jgi:HEAT repeat protein
MGDGRPGWSSSAVHQSSADVEASRLFELLLDGKEPQTRRRAAELLGHLNVARTEADAATIADALVEAVATDDDLGVRRRAIEALYDYGETHVDRLIEELAAAKGGDSGAATAFFEGWLDSEHPELRMVAVSSFRRLGDGSVVSSLREAFDDPDPRVRARAVEAYGHRESVPVEPIEPLLDDEYAHVRRAAARALAAIGSREALDRLVPVADDDDATSRRIAVEQLYRLDGERAAAVLVGSLSDRERGVRQQALRSLLRLVAGDGGVDVDRVSREVLENADAPPASETASLVDELLEGSGDGGRRERAVRLLGRLAALTETEAFRRRLIDRLDDGDDRVADAAMECLRGLDGKRLEKPLQLLRRDEATSAGGRRRAAALLEGIRDEAARALEGKSVEYTYVTEPSDYPIERGRSTE